MGSKVRQRTKLILAAIIVAIFTELVGCSSKAAPAKTLPPLGAPRATPLTAVLLPDKSQARVRAFQEKGGLSEAGAGFLALTRLDMVSTHENLYEFTATFPTNTQAKLTLRVIPGQKYKPSADERALPGTQTLDPQLTHAVKGGDYTAKLQYYVPEGTPLSGLADTRPGRTLLYRRIAPPSGTLAAYTGRSPSYGTGRHPQSDGDMSVLLVQLETVLVDARSELWGTIEEALLKEGLNADVGNPLGTTADSALDVIEALDMSVEYKEMMGQLDELQAEAENPTNPLTQKAYAEDPGVKQGIMDEIASARSELQWDTAVAYLNLELSVALGLFGSPVLSIAASPITTWNAETIKKLMRERIGNIRKMITNGIFNPSPTPTDSRDSDVIVPTENPDRTLPPGTWLASYYGTQVDETDTYTFTLNDSGAFTFTVGPDFQIRGTGKGSVSLQSVTDHGRTIANGSYSFEVTGVAFRGQIIELHFSRPTEIAKGDSTINDRQEPMPYETSINGPTVPRGSLALKSGESLTEELQETYPDGVKTTRKATLMIK